MLAAIVVPIGSWMAYQRSAEDFRQAKLARTAAEQKQLDLSTAVAAKAEELKVRDTRLEQEGASGRRWQSRSKTCTWNTNKAANNAWPRKRD